jgi:hypothetical protein
MSTKGTSRSPRYVTASWIGRRCSADVSATQDKDVFEQADNGLEFGLRSDERELLLRVLSSGDRAQW